MSLQSNVEIEKPQLIIPRLVYEKIMHMVQRGNGHECSGLGITRVIGKSIYVVDAWIVKQENSSATTDLDADAVNKLMFDNRDEEGKLNFWWHSHADMNVFWSATDKDTINKIGGEGMCVAAVFNKKREVRAAVSCQAQLPFMEDKTSIMLDELPISVYDYIDDGLKKEWDGEYESNVIEKYPTYPERTYPTLFNDNESDPEYWDTWYEKDRYEIDKDGSDYDIKKGKWKKSPTQIRLEKAERKANDKELAELDNMASKWDKLAKDPLVEDYNPIHDVVIMRDGSLVDFSEYMREKLELQRTSEKEVSLMGDIQ